MVDKSQLGARTSMRLHKKTLTDIEDLRTKNEDKEDVVIKLIALWKDMHPKGTAS